MLASDCSAIETFAEIVSSMMMMMMKLTQVSSVIDRVTDQEESEEGSDDGLSTCVFAVKVTSLDSATPLLRSVTLGERFVEANDALHAGTRATGTLCRFRGGDLGRNGQGRVGTNPTHSEGGGVCGTSDGTGEHFLFLTG